MGRKLLAIVTDELVGAEPLREMRKAVAGNGAVELRVIVPAVEANAFQHTLGDIDKPKLEAEERLQRVLALLRAGGIAVDGEVGDPDPIQAAQDALLEQPADEIVIFEHEHAQTRWFEEDMLQKAEAGLDPPLRMIVLHDEPDGEEHVVSVETVGRGTHDPADSNEIGSAYLVNFSRGDFAGMAAAIFGTILAAILAGAVSVDEGSVSGRAAAAVLLTMGLALINMAHVVGMLLMESVRYRGGFNVFFRNLSLVGTPLVIAINLALLLAA